MSNKSKRTVPHGMIQVSFFIPTAVHMDFKCYAVRHELTVRELLKNSLLEVHRSLVDKGHIKIK